MSSVLQSCPIVGSSTIYEIYSELFGDDNNEEAAVLVSPPFFAPDDLRCLVVKYNMSSFAVRLQALLLLASDGSLRSNSTAYDNDNTLRVTIPPTVTSGTSLVLQLIADRVHDLGTPNDTVFIDSVQLMDSCQQPPGGAFVALKIDYSYVVRLNSHVLLQ